MASIKYDSVGVFGSGTVDDKTAAALLDDWLPQNLGAVYRPVNIARKNKTLNAVVNWLESDDETDADGNVVSEGVLGADGTLTAEDMVQTLLDRAAESGDNVTLVYIRPEGDIPVAELDVLKAAKDNGIIVKDLAAALDDLDLDELFPEPEPTPEPEPVAEAEPAPVFETPAFTDDAPVAVSFVESLTPSVLAVALEEAVRAIVRDEMSKLVVKAIPPKADHVASKEDLDAVKGKLADAPFDGGKVDPVAAKKITPQEDNTEGKLKYYVNEDGEYRKALARPRRGDTVAYLTQEEVDELTASGKIK